MIYDVIIAGAGPVGLFLACELRLRRLSVLVLEKLTDPHTPLKSAGIGGRGLNLPSVEAFYRRGLLRAVRHSAIMWFDPAAQPQAPAKPDTSAPAPPPRFLGHFAGIMIDANKVDLSHNKFMLPGPSASGGMVSLEGIEDLLTERAKHLGVEIRYGAELTGFTEDCDGITVETANETFRAQWLVGCDGGRSTVRKRAGFDFAGTAPEFTGTVGIADIADPEKLRPGFNLTPHGMYTFGAGPGRCSFIEFDTTSANRDARETPVTLEAFQAGMRRVSGTDVTITALHLSSRYTDVARQATTYRKGRVLLAGDAAHVHSPLGGQGMNLGIGDAMNLGWKLAPTIHGTAPEGLLDTYTAERHPIGAWALNWTRAQVAIMRPDPHSQAIASVIRDLTQTRDGASYFAEKISGIWLRYDLGGSHPLVGHSAPDFEFEDGTRLGDLLHQGTALLLQLNSSRTLQPLAAPYAACLKYHSAKAKIDFGLTAVFIRPDGFVAWAADAEPDPTALTASLTRWLGPPSRSSRS